MKTAHDVITEFVAQHSSAVGVDPDDDTLELTSVLDSLALVELIYTVESRIGRPLELEQIIDGERLQRERLENWIGQFTPVGRGTRGRSDQAEAKVP